MISTYGLRSFVILATLCMALSVQAQVGPGAQPSPGISTMPGTALAPTAKVDPKAAAEAVNTYIASRSTGGTMAIYDRGGQIQLRLKHKSTDDALTRSLMVGNYITCATFTDDDGGTYEVDFLLAQAGPDELQVISGGTNVRVAHGEVRYEWIEQPSRGTYHRSDEASKKLAASAPEGELEPEDDVVAEYPEDEDTELAPVPDSIAPVEEPLSEEG